MPQPLPPDPKPEVTRSRKLISISAQLRNNSKRLIAAIEVLLNDIKHKRRKRTK